MQLLLGPLACVALLLAAALYRRMTSQEDSFLYFAYGSNMLTERIRINNPSASFQGLAKLKEHRLDFNHLSKKWGGAVATIEEEEGREVWGVLWKLSLDDLPRLDKQEGVPKLYRRRSIEVETDGGLVAALTYQMAIPALEDRRPSKIYRQVILTGAAEHSLPDHYREELEKIEHNHGTGDGSIKLTTVTL